MLSSSLVVLVIAAVVVQWPVNGSEPNLCDAKGTIQCDNYQTCCLFSNGQHGCCPFTAANCCPDLDSCCPAGFRCGNSSCIRM